MFEALVALVSLVAGVVASVVGFGIGSLLTPLVATQMDMRIAVAAVSIPHFLATAYRFWLVRTNIDREVLKGFGVSSALGALAGALAGTAIQSDWLALLLAALLLFVGIGGLIGYLDKMRFEGPSRYVAGIASGLFGGLVGNQGGVRSAALLGFDLDKSAFIATATASGLIVDVFRMPVYAFSYRSELIENMPVIGVMTAGCLVGTVIGKRVLNHVPELAFRKVVCAVLIVVGVFVCARFVLTR
jgi:uncharacterized membrane protein YfcA